MNVRMFIPLHSDRLDSLLTHPSSTAHPLSTQREVGAWSSPIPLAKLGVGVSGATNTSSVVCKNNLPHASMGVVDAIGGLRQLGAFVGEAPSGSMMHADINALHFVWRVRVLNNSGLPLKLAQLGAAGSTEISLPVVSRSPGAHTPVTKSVPWFWSDARSRSTQQDIQHHEQHQGGQEQQQLLMSVQVAGTDCGWSQVKIASLARPSHPRPSYPLVQSPGTIAGAARPISSRIIQRGGRLSLCASCGSARGDEHFVQLPGHLRECRRH
jgi:hypothetical protein